jgi:hypothetical protein
MCYLDKFYFEMFEEAGYGDTTLKIRKSLKPLITLLY